MKFRVGFGYDMHRLETGYDLWIGGIKIDFEKGLVGHSDADVLIHAICDALLGAVNARDIGYHFPNTSSEFENVDSKILLACTREILKEKGAEIGNIDATVCTEQPKLNPHVPAMQKVLSETLQIDIQDISIKATTSEKMGFVGRQEGITAYAVALIYQK